MINLGVLIFGIIVTRGFFATLPMMFPRVDKEIYLPYELWIYALVVFMAVLPHSVGSYVYTLKAEGR